MEPANPRTSSYSPNPVSRNLFGGAIKTSIPEDFADVSDFREVPDNQEIFVSDSEYEISVMIDILERSDIPDPASAEYHFDAIATANEVDFDNLEDWRVFGSFYVPDNLHQRLPGVQCFSIRGFQRVVKGHYKGSIRPANGTPEAGSSVTPEKEYVLVYVAVFRLGERNTDIVVSLNLPVRSEEGIRALKSDDGTVVENFLKNAPGVSVLEPIMLAIVENFEVVDWNLFDVDEQMEEDANDTTVV